MLRCDSRNVLRHHYAYSTDGTFLLGLLVIRADPEDMLPRYYMHNDMINMFKYVQIFNYTAVCTRRERVNCIEDSVEYDCVRMDDLDSFVIDAQTLKFKVDHKFLYYQEMSCLEIDFNPKNKYNVYDILRTNMPQQYEREKNLCANVPRRGDS